MGEKSGKKREYIIEKAREVFAQKGFLTVTMKDIVEACEISRGGLYLYFDDTASLFLEVLKKERESDGGEEIEGADTSVEMLSAFLREQKKEILGIGESLIGAVYEYCFYLKRREGEEKQQEKEQETDPAGDGDKESAKEPREDFLTEEAKRFAMSVKVLHSLIRAGIREGYLDCEKPLQEAYNIMYAIEGLKICAMTSGVSEQEVTDEINFLFSHLFIREE